MNMFCYQCQETAKNSGCTIGGACGKKAETSGIQDVLIYGVKGLAWYARRLPNESELIDEAGRFIMKALFMTITNANFDDSRFITALDELQALRKRLEKAAAETKRGDTETLQTRVPGAASWSAVGEEDYRALEYEAGILREENEDLRSLKELTIYGLKGIAAYGEHALVLGYEEREIFSFMIEALSSTLEDRSMDELIALVLKTGEYGVKTMALLDRANSETYGNPEITSVSIGVRGNPGILISGHDLKDMEELLKQTEGTGVDVYTHSEMLPAHYYPAFKKYSHFAGNYGNAWWKQDKEFDSFNGPILMTTNCIVPVRDSYKDRIWTTGQAGYPGVSHIPNAGSGLDSTKNGPNFQDEIREKADKGKKDFSPLIEAAKKCPSPAELEQGEITGGFAHAQVLDLADKIVDAVTSGAIKRFIVMAGCDGRQKGRNYFTEVARELPRDTVILTAGCAKYRYNKLDLGDIGGIPRVLDAGQCNDSYSLALIALKLKEVFELDNVNDLPISFDIAWYEQKAVIVLLALLFLGFKGMRIGPTLPAFLSPNVAKVLVETFELKLIGDAKTDVADMTAGK